MQYWAAIIDARDPGGGQDCNDARRGTHRIQVERDDAACGLALRPDGGMKRTARLDDVVDVRRCAGDVQMRGLSCGSASPMSAVREAASAVASLHWRRRSR